MNNSNTKQPDPSAVPAAPDTNVTPEEKELLQRSSESMGTGDDEALRKATLDNTDEEGKALNEAVNLSGDELDVPGSEDDDENEAIGKRMRKTIRTACRTRIKADRELQLIL